MSPPSKRKRGKNSPLTSQKVIKPLVSQNENDPQEIDRKYYIKTHATGGYCGNEYEIKLSGLIWLNLKYDDDVKDFLLATNVAAVCPLDDICFKIIWKDEKRKPFMVFIQIKHKINEKKPSIKLGKMFSAYQKIKEIMNEEDDGLFERKFDEFECYPILYTNEDFTLKTDLVTDNNYCPKLSDIIGTRGLVRKLSEKGKEGNIKNMREKIKDWSENEFNAFVNSLLVFSRQASEMGVEEILKEYINKHPRAYKNPFPLEPHPVTLKFISMFANWWKEVEQPYCLTKKDDLLENAFNAIIKNPWINSLNIIYKSKINDCYEFNDDAVSSLKLQDQRSSTVITTENSILTVVKVLQHLDNNHHAVLDLEYIANLQHGNRKALCEELKTKEDYVVILVCDNIPKNETFKDIEEVVRNLKRIIISNNNKTTQNLKDFFPVGEGEEHWEVHDEKNRLTDMSEESQFNILETTTIIFQDKEVNLATIINDDTKKYVKGDILHKIFNRKTISVGKLIVESKYDEIKHFWVDRRVGHAYVKPKEFNSNRKIPLNTLKDIKDDVVLLTANPGMGKSTLLTHLSIKTKDYNPEIWIFRINLLEYTDVFSEWQDETTIDLLQALKFMCQVILGNELQKASHEDLFTLDIKDNVVFLKHCTADPQIEFKLNLFLNFYYEREMIFLFDGFDEICTLYSDVVIQFVKTVSNGPRKHKTWITSRPYNQVKSNLEEDFALELSYEIENFTENNMELYLQLFFEFHLKVEDLNETQLDNVKKLLEHVLSVCDELVPEPVRGSLYGVIKNAALYLSYKIMNGQIPLWRYNKNYHHEIYLKTPYHLKDECNCCACCYCIGKCTTCNNTLFRFPVKRVQCDANPLILYLAAVDVVHNIKKVNKNIEEWYLDVNHYTIYKNFLEKKIERQFQEKDGNKISKPKNKTKYDKEVASSISKHKKMAAYYIFNFHADELFTEKDLEEIKEMIEDVQIGEETNGLIDHVANGVPIFAHRTFAEFFAVEYICDCLKIEHISEKSLFLYFDVIFLKGYQQNVAKIFDHKIKIDKSFVSSLENNKDMIFKWIDNNADELTFTTVENELYSTEFFFYDIIRSCLKNTKYLDSENEKFGKIIFIRALTRKVLDGL